MQIKTLPMTPNNLTSNDAFVPKKLKPKEEIILLLKKQYRYSIISIAFSVLTIILLIISMEQNAGYKDDFLSSTNRIEQSTNPYLDTTKWKCIGDDLPDFTFGVFLDPYLDMRYDRITKKWYKPIAVHPETNDTSKNVIMYNNKVY